VVGIKSLHIHNGGEREIERVIIRGCGRFGEEGNEQLQGWNYRSGTNTAITYSIRHLGGGEDGEGQHDTIGEFLTDLGDEKGTHTRSSSSSHGVGDLKSLEAVTGFRLLPNNVQDGID
jgi:hypothetical protein